LLACNICIFAELNKPILYEHRTRVLAALKILAMLEDDYKPEARGLFEVARDRMRTRKDLIIERREVIVRDAKGGRDRVSVAKLLANLFDRFRRQRKLREPGVSLPTALLRKFPSAATQWGCQWVFPASSLCRMRTLAVLFAIISSRKSCSAWSRRRFIRRAFRSRQAVIRSGMFCNPSA